MKRITSNHEVYILGNLIKKVLTGQIRTGRFRPAQEDETPLTHAETATSLLNAINHGYPIGSIVLWDTQDDQDTTPPLSAKHGGGPRPNGTISYIADGVRRLTALVRTLTGPETNTAGAGNPQVFYSLVSERFMTILHGTHGARWYMPADSLMQTTEYMNLCDKVVKTPENRNDPERTARFMDRADSLTAALRDCQIPVTRITEATLDDAITIYKFTRTETAPSNYI